MRVDGTLVRWTAVTLVLICGGCTVPVTLSEDFGASLEQAKQAQRRPLEPGASAEFPNGMNGRASEQAIDRYVNSFHQQSPAGGMPGVGGGGGIANPGLTAQ